MNAYAPYVEASGDDLAAAILAVEAATGGTVCCHDFDGAVAAAVGDGRIQHRLPCCSRAKARLPAVCTACDLHACQAHLAGRPSGFWKVCHAGLLECYVPMRSEDRNLGALFLGPWRWDGSGLPAGGLAQRPSGLGPGSAPPAPARRDLPRILALARLLADAIGRAASAATPSGGRRSRILRLVDEHLHAPFRLAELAAELRLSTSRCGHVVRQETGLTFPALVESRRLDRSRRMLIGTDLAVVDIARRCGFADAGWFHRRFRARYGTTPAAWRTAGGA